jgi:hypothetical protein
MTWSPFGIYLYLSLRNAINFILQHRRIGISILLTLLLFIFFNSSSSSSSSSSSPLGRPFSPSSHISEISSSSVSSRLNNNNNNNNNNERFRLQQQRQQQNSRQRYQQGIGTFSSELEEIGGDDENEETKNSVSDLISAANFDSNEATNKNGKKNEIATDDQFCEVKPSETKYSLFGVRTLFYFF